MNELTRAGHPFHPEENPVFLPGDKVRDKRDVRGKIWRIVARVAYYDSELMTLRSVEESQQSPKI